jgi:UDP-N-acetylmuramoylalanine--D-glutamate ligase
VTGVALVHGLAVTGLATAEALQAHGWDVLVSDDAPSAAAHDACARLGLDIVAAPDAATLAGLLARVDLVSPAPGVPEHHPVVTAALELGIPLRSEIDLAWSWEQERPGGPRPMLAITGTDGKTTTTLLATAMAEASGRRAVACGNTELPLVSALDRDVDVFVVECTSFRLFATTVFRPVAATWLNLADDHLDWHDTRETYQAAKARIWAFQEAGDVAIGFADDPAVLRNLARARARRVTFAREGADWFQDGEVLRGPYGDIAEVSSLRRALPHDITNGLAAAATVVEPGVGTLDGAGLALATFTGPHHRIELVAEAGGVTFYDDSKATTPHAALTAVRGFTSVVLLAGGRNKGLDLGVLAAAAPRLRAVVALGESAGTIERVFSGRVPVDIAADMDDAVRLAREAAQPGDVVLLSPACASWDWYQGGYAERGDDFARAVREQLGVS